VPQQNNSQGEGFTACSFNIQQQEDKTTMLAQPAVQQRASPGQLTPTPLATHLQAMPGIPAMPKRIASLDSFIRRYSEVLIMLTK